MIQVRLEARRFHYRRVTKERRGRGQILADCPFCSAQVKIYLWSLAGSGKLCACGAKFTSVGRCEAMVEQDPDADPPQPKIPDPAIDPRGHSAPLPARVPRPAIHPRSHSAPLPARVPRPTIATVAAAIERPLPDATRSTTLRVEKTSRSRPGRPQHEVIAPAGWSFDAPGRPHGLIRSTRDQAIEAGEATELVRCPPGCWCGLSDEEDR